ncbi:MAG TPA: class IV adenylate cyclase [Tepidisphaeraceae bacterium]|nr:class IV adenylate cyclase [Tepidisphaeraceae bacterium]
MPVEIEIKLKVDDLAPIREKLKSLSAKRVGEVAETNIFFDTPDRALLASDRGLRLRRSRDLVTNRETLAVTFKGPRAEGPVKRREEIELTVDSASSAIDLLARLGFARNLGFEKQRETWTLERATIELDTLPGLGSFVEIESTSDAEVMRLCGKLGLTHLTPITSSYPDLVTQHLSERGTHENMLAFE